MIFKKSINVFSLFTPKNRLFGRNRIVEASNSQNGGIMTPIDFSEMFEIKTCFEYKIDLFDSKIEIKQF
jgi:hypothetical protein